MASLSLTVGRFSADQSGGTAIEYGLIAGLVTIGLLAALILLGGGVTGLYDFIVGTAGATMAGAGG